MPRRSTTQTGRRATATTSRVSRSRASTTSSSPTAARIAASLPLWWRSWRFLELPREDRGRAAHARGFQGLRHRLPLPEAGALRERRSGARADLRRLVPHHAPRGPTRPTWTPPYWEQLQYVGDTRIDALLNYTLAGEERLARRSILHFDWSRGAYDITAEPLPHRRGAADPALRALLRQHGARLLELPRRAGFRARTAAGGARVDRLVPRAAAGRRPRRLPALLDPRRHGHLAGRGHQGGGRPLAGRHAAARRNAAPGGRAGGGPGRCHAAPPFIGGSADASAAAVRTPLRLRQGAPARHSGAQDLGPSINIWG